MIKIPKIHIEGALYYVTTRGDNNEDVFKEPEDYKTYLGLLRKYKEQYGFKLFSFVLAPNHLHLLFELKVGITISDIMHDLNANYTKYFNSKYQRKGHLFQERSKMVLAEKDKYLLPILAYMHLNPCYCVIASEQRERSNLKEIASSPEFTLSEAEGAPRNGTHRLDSYPYSSHVLYSAINASDSVFEGLDLAEEINEVSRLAGLAVNYTNFMKNIPQEEMKILGSDLKKKPILSSEEFIQKVEAAVQPSDSREPITEHRTPNSDNRLLIGSMIVIILGIFTIFLYARSIALKKNLNQEMARKDAEISTKLVIERKKVNIR